MSSNEWKEVDTILDFEDSLSSNTFFGASIFVNDILKFFFWENIFVALPDLKDRSIVRSTQVFIIVMSTRPFIIVEVVVEYLAIKKRS